MPTAKMKANIVGSTFYPRAGEIIQRLRPGAKLRLVREPNSQYDKNAVAVFYDFSGKEFQLGHLSRGLAELLAPRIDAGLAVTCTKAPILGGVVHLEWEQAEELPKEAQTGDAFLSRFKGLLLS